MQRCSVWDRRKSGVVIHSYYNGYPWLRGPKAKISETAFKTWIEPALVATFGLLLRQVDEANGSYFLFCAFAMCLKNLVGTHLVNEELTDMHDSQIEQQHMAGRFRQTSDYNRTGRR